MSEVGDKEDKPEFTSEGETLGYISLDQAQILAMRTAREAPGAYGRRFARVPMAFEAGVHGNYNAYVNSYAYCLADGNLYPEADPHTHNRGECRGPVEDSIE